MNQLSQQSKTYQARQQIKRSVRNAPIGWRHWNFVVDYAKEHKNKIAILFSLLMLQALMEVVVFMFANGTLRDRTYVAFHQGYIWQLVVVVLIGMLLYLLISFYALKFERQVVLHFINKLRRSWFGIILGSSEHTMTHHRQADFIAKASYHFPLLSLGIDNSVLGIMRWSLCALVIFIVGSIGGGYLLLVSIGIVLVSLVVLFIAYIVANHYISQEVASYSQVIRHIDSSLSEFASIKKDGQESTVIQGLDARVDTDTYFRIRRDIWLRYFNKIIYTLVFIGTLGILVFGFYNPDILLPFYAGDELFLLGIIALYSLRLLYEAGRTGLYIPPLKLGLFLSVPEHMPKERGIRSEKKWSTLSFRSNKTKLFLEGSYIKNIDIPLEAQKSYLFLGKPYVGKTSLAEVFAGTARFNINSWLVKVDDSRQEYRVWAGQNMGIYFVSSYFRSEKTIGEIIFGKDKQFITAEDIFSLHEIAQKHPLLSRVVSKRRFIGDSLRSFEANNTLLFATYILHCLVCKPKLIVIDNMWIDMGYPEIVELIKLVRGELPESTVVAFSRSKNDIISYDTIYEIKDNQIDRI